MEVELEPEARTRGARVTGEWPRGEDNVLRTWA